jgi:osmotically-inducible protein OsmY
MSGGGYGSYGNRNQNRSTWMWPSYRNRSAYGSYGTQSAAGFGGYGTYSTNTGFGSYGANAGATSYTIYGPETGTGYTGSYGSRGTVGTEPNTNDWNNANWSGDGWATASDQDIENEICRRLTQAGNVDASDIEVTVSQRVVTLSGTVDSRQSKREAGTIADSIPGVEDVNNNLRIDQGLLHTVESTL